MEILSQPGESLRGAREGAGLSVSDVVHQTKFPRSIVEALEKDDYTVFSSPTYARSYLSQYAGFLGVDPSKWLDFFEPAIFKGPQDVLSMIDSPVDHEPRPASAAAKSSNSGNMVPTILLVFLTIGLIYGVIEGYAYLESKLGGNVVIKTGVPSDPTAAPLPVTGTPANVGPEAPAAAPVESGPPPRATIVRED